MLLGFFIQLVFLCFSQISMGKTLYQQGWEKQFSWIQQFNSDVYIGPIANYV